MLKTSSELIPEYGCIIVIRPYFCIGNKIKFKDMKPIDFKESTKVLGRPSTMTAEECGSLPVWSDGRQCVSCWKPSFRERLKILFSGKVWLGVLSMGSQPPVYVTADSIFPRMALKWRVADFLSSVKERFSRIGKRLSDGFKQPDKRKHLAAGFIISLAVGILCPLLGFALGCIAGALKEWWDSKGHGTVELMDFVFTCLGSLAALPFSFIIHFLIW